MLDWMNWLRWLDPAFIVQTLGGIGVVAVVFAESGLFFGFFFPGDSLLFTAGLLASQNYLNIWWLLPGVILAAILGDSVGYWFGAKIGPRIFCREDSFFFHKRHLIQTHDFYRRHGRATLILARFIPVIRTFAPILAGVGRMPYREFLTFNIIGGLLWGGGVTLTGYFLGTIIPGIDRYLIPIVLAIIIISLLPALRHFRFRRSEL